MRVKRTESATDELEEAVESAVAYLTDRGIVIENVTPQDLIAYFDGEAPNGDTTTLRGVIRHRWLMIHEIVEISELKRRRLGISVLTLRSHPGVAIECHLIATRTEFRLAKQEKDHDWLKRRVPLIRSWRNDDGMTDRLWSQYLELEGEFREYIQG